MAKKGNGKAPAKPKPAGHETLKRLPKSRNGTHRKTAGLGCYQYQKDHLKAEARKAGMTVSYYLNHKLWKDWL
jgi:hypothetical protein